MTIAQVICASETMLKFKYMSQGSLKTLGSSGDPITARSLRLNQVFQVKLTCSHISVCAWAGRVISASENGFKLAAVAAELTSLSCVCVYCLQGRVSLCGQQGGGCSVGREEFLEALLQLYLECTSPELMKIHHVAKFVNKCKHHFYSCGNVFSLPCVGVFKPQPNFLVIFKAINISPGFLKIFFSFQSSWPW